jgi:hypothetical protein
MRSRALRLDVCEVQRRSPYHRSQPPQGKDEKISDLVRRALRLLDREAWEERARADMHRLRTEDLSAEADAWEYDTDGNIRITGSGLTVPARSADRA